jgi:hypothetical protein
VMPIMLPKQRKMPKHIKRHIALRALATLQAADKGWHPLRWTRRGDCEPSAEVEIRLVLQAEHGTAWLRYDVDHRSCRTGQQQYAVSMVTTPCRFGGVRWWWICPATGRRVGRLHLPDGGTHFLSRGRGAYRLAYASQRRGQMDQMHARCRRLYARLGVDHAGPLSAHRARKPKWMRWKIYGQIAKQIEVGEERLNVMFMAQARRLLSRGERTKARGTSSLGVDWSGDVGTSLRPY